MASDGRKPPRGRALRVLLASVASAFAVVAWAAPAAAEVVFENAPAAGSEGESLSFAETGTAELGSLLRLDGAARVDPTVRLEMTNRGEPASVPITVSVYAPASDREPGPLLARETQSFELAAAGAQPVELAFPGLALPDEAIVSVAFEAGEVGVVLAGPPVAGASPREGEGIYRAARSEGAVTPLAFEAAPLAWQGRQPAFTVAAVDRTPPPAAPAPPTAVPAPTRSYRNAYTVPPSKRMSLSFPRATARIAGPGALVQVRCTGSSAARCIGTLSLTAAGAVHKAAFSIGKGRRQYVVVPLGADLGRLDRLRAPRATAAASTIQAGGAAVRTKRALKLK